MSVIDVIVFSTLSLIKERHLISSIFPVLFVIYGCQPIIFYYGLKYTNMSMLNLSWNLISNILVTSIGLLYIGNVITLVQCTGIIFGMIALYLMNV
jgi:hypothetical protein